MQVTLSCSDDASGCASTKYCTDASNTCTPSATYSGAFALSSEGTNYVRYASTDNAGKTEAAKSSGAIKIDKTKPAIPFVSDSPDPVESSKNITFSPACSDSVSGCKRVTIAAPFGSCTAPAGGTCDITAPACEYNSYTYNATAEDNAGWTNTSVAVGGFTVKKGNGCPCLASPECSTGCAGGTCGEIKSVSVGVFSVSGMLSPQGTTINSTAVNFGTASRITITVSNPNAISKEIVLHIDGFDESRNWAWFRGHRADKNRHDLNVTLAPFESRTIDIDVLGAKTGRYKIYFGPDADYKKRYGEMEIRIVHKNKGLFSTTPDISPVTFILLLLAGAAIAVNRKLF